MIKKLTLCILIIFSFNASFAQNDSASDIRINKAYIKSYWTDTKEVFISPFKWSGKQWVGAGSVIGLTAIISTQDLKINRFFQSNRSSLSDKISTYGLEPFGSGLYSMSIVGGFYIYGELGNNSRAKKVGLLGIKTFVLSGVINYVFKETFHRHRPYQVKEELKNGEIAALTQYEVDGPFAAKTDFSSLKGIVKGFKDEFNYTSFPSGHTVSAFAIATIIASEYNDHKWVPVVSYSIATLAGLSRINDDKHWASDVFMGAALGYGMAKLIYNHNNWGVKMTPVVSSGMTGMLIILPVR